jgi:TonB family protein
MTALAETILAFWPRTVEGWASHIWQSTIAGCAILWLLTACQRLTAGTRRTIAWVGLAKFAIPASGLLALAGSLPFLPEHWAVRRAPVISIPLPEIGAPIAHGSSAPLNAPAIGVVIAAIWLAVSLLFFLTWIVRGIRLRRQVLAAALPLSPRMQDSVATAAARVGLRRIPRCAKTKESQGPGILGVAAPVVILPEGLEETLGAEELQSILVHEFVHVRRGDTLLSMLQALILSFFWFDPVAWFLSRRICVETEKSCDEQVLRITGNPDAYVDGIMKALHHSLGLPQPAFAEAAAMPVVSRINGILSQGSRLRRPVFRNTAIAAACLVAALSGYAGFLVAAPPSPATPRDLTDSDRFLSNSGSTGQFGQTRAFAVNLVAGAPEMEIFDISDVDQPPAVLARVRPHYPTSLLNAPVYGEVVVGLTIDSAGNADDLRVVRSSASEFESAALEAVSLWSFTPAQKSGRRVNARGQVTVEFTPPHG